MDLLGQNTQKKEKSKGQKMILILLVLLISILIIMISALFLLKSDGNNKNTLTVIFNNNNIPMQNYPDMVITDENQKLYISIKDVTELLGYEYLRGAYLEYAEDNSKGYIENENKEIIGFEADSNKIYKTTKNSKTDYEYYELKNNIKKINDKLYISLDDLAVGCNLNCSYSSDSKKIVINTIDNILESYKAQITEKKLEIKLSEVHDHKKLVLHNMLVASNKTGKMGVIDSKYNSIIGYKYDTIEFNEYGQNFIVSNEDKYGILSMKGDILLDIRFEEIDIINYSPLLYQIKLNNKYGVLDEERKLILNPEYDKIGNDKISNNSICIIKNIKENEDGLIVSKDNKYGILSLKTGEPIIEYEIDDIYIKEDAYYVKIENDEFELQNYIENKNTTIVVTN